MNNLKIYEDAHRKRCGTSRRFCYTEVPCADFYRLAIVEEDEPGYYPLSEDYGCGNRHTVRAIADDMNRQRLGLTADQAIFIVASSMKGTKR
jgi:hypothetical protein